MKDQFIYLMFVGWYIKPLKRYLKKTEPILQCWIIFVFLSYVQFVNELKSYYCAIHLFFKGYLFGFLNSDAVNICNLFNEKLQWTVPTHTINGWSAYNKWKCHHSLAINAWIIFKNLCSFPSATFNSALWFKFYSKWMAIFNYCSSVLWEIVTIMINSHMENN